ncbi:HNH endonuclease signature motif containing protein [Mycobacterium marinum]|uniref:HNH endonuclease signature motif containing protein n=1 Tax=Mycobacterium marinum TaxID=1781 RepID=UPI0023585BB3|nr:HNH endonuclease signature motif containing protein [Mycobacterium marinum]MDC8980598.1 HNH endonuclease signature motif containing protein [Mycobacterium marinum]MDC8997977.1 HNH endonuclease signature motif containing protein [Mycobacterium marinum]MDC9008717.1 HNH endonuclease signature motif containing protein [Mycobacterium marinum]
MFEFWYASRATSESAALLDRVGEAARSEAQSAAGRLVAIGELFVLRCRESGERAQWATDTWEAVAAQVAARLRCSVAMGASYLRYAMAMRDRLPLVGKVFESGDIDYRSFQTIVFRTDLIADADVLAKVDAQVAALVSRRPSLTRGGLGAAVDQIVTKVDHDAVRQAHKAASDRYVDVIGNGSGMAWVEGSVVATAGQALDRRLDELAATVCAADPRTRKQRRADALGALAAGIERLVCGCGSSRCAASEPERSSNIVIHVIAERASVEGAGTAPGVLAGSEWLVPAELVAELAKSARLVPVIRPAEIAEPRYTPSAQLADFVRCRDLTCRAPGCDRPAADCDVDHTVPYAAGGLTHPSNLKCLCRKHHLLKTFWGWRDQQLPDGTVIWGLPDGHVYVTTPGSAWLFPSLCAPTGRVPTRSAAQGACGDGRGAMMPQRRRTRAQQRAHLIATERRRNRQARQPRTVFAQGSDLQTRTCAAAEEPPPF